MTIIDAIILLILHWILNYLWYTKGKIDGLKQAKKNDH